MLLGVRQAETCKRFFLALDLRGHVLLSPAEPCKAARSLFLIPLYLYFSVGGLSSAHDEAGPIFIVCRLSTVDRLHCKRLGRPRLILPLLTSQQDVPSLYPMTEFAWLGREFVICLDMTNDVETTTTDVTPHISTFLRAS